MFQDSQLLIDTIKAFLPGRFCSTDLQDVGKSDGTALNLSCVGGLPVAWRALDVDERMSPRIALIAIFNNVPLDPHKELL